MADHSLPNGPLRQTPEQQISQQPMTLAFYNVIMLLFAISCILALVAGYFLFLDFITPLLWAIICGIVLFPVKRSLTGKLKNWLDGLSALNTPISLALFLIPLRLADGVGQTLLAAFAENCRAVLLIGASFPCASLVLHYNLIPKILVLVIPAIYLLYVVLTALFPVLGGRSFMHSTRLAALFWYMIVAHVSNYVGPFRAPLFLAVVLSCSVLYWLLVQDTGSEKRSSKTSFKRLRKSSSEKAGTDDNAENVDSTQIIKWLLVACFFVYLSLHLWLVGLILIPIAISVAKHLTYAFDVHGLIGTVYRWFRLRCADYWDLIIPLPCQRLCQLLMMTDKKIIWYLRDSMDAVGSLVSMIALGLGFFAITAFMFVQVYQESINLVTLTSTVAQSFADSSPGFKKWLSENYNVSTVADARDRFLENWYQHGRQWVSFQVHDLLRDNQEKAAEAENQLLNAMELIHTRLTFNIPLLKAMRAHESSGAAGELTTSNNPVMGGWSEVWGAVEAAAHGDAWDFAEKMSDNFHLIYSFIESTWLIVTSNMGLLLSTLGQTLGVVLASGSAVFNFLMDVIVFLSFLFYLLCSSGEQYKPLTLLQQYKTRASNQNTIAGEIEEAVNGVFAVTLKMAMFYGLFTWLTHTLFAVSLVFIPSVLAAVFAAIPLLGTCLVVVPGALEIWLIKGEPFLAAFFLAIHIAANYIVDDIIYAEIKIIHPFLTALSIAGGMLWWGLEGAIFGPIVLCCIVATISIYRNLVMQQWRWINVF